MKNNLDYFTHPVERSRTKEFKALRARYGYEGQGRFDHLEEIMAESDNCRLDLEDDLALDSLADDLSMRTDELQEFLTFLEQRCRLIVRDESGAVTTERLQEDLARVMQTREAARERKRRESKGRESPDDELEQSSGELPDSSPKLRQTPPKFGQTYPQSRAEQTRPDETRAASSETRTTLDAVDIQRILGPVVDLRPGEDTEFASTLSAAGLDEPFLNWFIRRVHDTREERGIKSVKGFIVAFVRNPESYQTWIDEFQQGRIRNRPSGPSTRCPMCDSPMKRADDRARCKACGRDFTLINGEWIDDEGGHEAVS